MLFIAYAHSYPQILCITFKKSSVEIQRSNDNDGADSYVQLGGCSWTASPLLVVNQVFVNQGD